MHHVTCLRCNRVLKDAKSQARGYGPVCNKKINQEEKAEQLELIEKKDEK